MVPAGDDHDTDEQLAPVCADCAAPVPPPRHVWLCSGCLGTAQDAGLIQAVRDLDRDGVAGPESVEPECTMCGRGADDIERLLSCLPRRLCDSCFRLPWNRPATGR